MSSPYSWYLHLHGYEYCRAPGGSTATEVEEWSWPSFTGRPLSCSVGCLDLDYLDVRKRNLPVEKKTYQRDRRTLRGGGQAWRAWDKHGKDSADLDRHFARGQSRPSSGLGAEWGHSSSWGQGQQRGWERKGEGREDNGGQEKQKRRRRKWGVHFASLRFFRVNFVHFDGVTFSLQVFTLFFRRLVGFCRIFLPVLHLGGFRCSHMAIGSR